MGAAASKADQTLVYTTGMFTRQPQNSTYLWEICSKRLTFLCSEAWPQYSLDNSSESGRQPELLDFNILHELDNYCWRTGKWSEVPYVQALAVVPRPTLVPTVPF